MGILVQKDEENSRLQERIAADLHQRASESSKQVDFDGVEDSAMLEGTKKTNRFSWFWAILVVLALLSLLVIFFIK